jgi:phosphatidylglycerophosphate synthase
VYTYKYIENFKKEPKSLLRKYFYDKFSILIVIFILKIKLKVNPIVISVFGLALGLISAYLFLNEKYFVAILFFQLSITMDCVDGYIAKIYNNGSKLGVIIDGLCDYLVIILNLIALDLSLDQNLIFKNMTFIYLLFIAIEKNIERSIENANKFYSKVKVNKILLNKVKNFLEKKNLKVLLFNNHERYFLIFFIGPIFSEIYIFFLLSIFLSLFFLFLKIRLDLN